MHDEDFVCPTNPVQCVLKLKTNYDYAVRANKLVLDRERVMTLIRKVPPKMNHVKLNRDGIFKENNIHSCGGVLRGSQGKWLGGFAKCVGECSAFLVDVWRFLKV